MSFDTPPRVLTPNEKRDVKALSEALFLADKAASLAQDAGIIFSHDEARRVRAAMLPLAFQLYQARTLRAS